MQTHVSEAELLAKYIDEDTGEIIYPTSDGNRMAESTEHFEQITSLKGNIESLFSENTDVFVAGDLLWYPEEGKPYISAAPDTMVVFGRPKGYRSSYEQWNEENIAPAVVFEILSKSNTVTEMLDKFLFYQKYGVQEYYIYDHLKEKFYGWVRDKDNNNLNVVLIMPTFKSPLLNITFEMYENSKLKIFNPDGSQFITFVQNIEKRKKAEQLLEQEKIKVEQEKERAEQEKTRAEQEKTRADKLEQDSETQRIRAEKAEKEIALIKKLLQEKGFELE